VTTKDYSTLTAQVKHHVIMSIHQMW